MRMRDITTPIVVEIVKRMGGGIKSKEMNNTSRDVWGYDIEINGAEADFFMGTESGLGVEYHDPDFLEKFSKELIRRLKGVRPKPHIDRHHLSAGHYSRYSSP